MLSILSMSNLLLACSVFELTAMSLIPNMLLVFCLGTSFCLDRLYQMNPLQSRDIDANICDLVSNVEIFYAILLFLLV